MAYELLPYEALPAWFRDNPYIGSGYRVEIGWRNAVASLCHLHNETVNIWTHAVAFALVLVLLVVTLVAMSPHGVDRIDLDVVHMADVVSQQQSAAAELRLADFRSAVCTASSPSYNCSADGADSADERRSAAAASAHSSFVSGLEALFSSSSAFLPSAVSEGYGRLQRHLPIVQRLTQALRAQADSMASLLSSSSPALLSPFPPLSSLSSTPARFVAFLTRVESHLSSLHSAVSSRVTVDNALRLKALLVDNVGGFTQQLTLPQVDVLRLVRALIDDFLRSTREGETGTGEQRAELHDGRDDASQHSHEMGRSDDTASPTAARADGDDDVGGAVGLAVRVKRWAGLSGADLLFALSDERALLAPADVLELTRRRQWEEDVQLHLYLPRWPLTAFMVSALACLLFSALFHCFQAVSRPVSVLFQNMDYAGITLLIAGSNIPVIYYGFYCAPLTAAVYNGVISALAGVCFLITVLPAFRDLRFRTLKTLLFLALGFSGVGPLIHLIVHLEHVHFIVFYLLAMVGTTSCTARTQSARLTSSPVLHR